MATTVYAEDDKKQAPDYAVELGVESDADIHTINALISEGKNPELNLAAYRSNLLTIVLL